MDRLNDMIDNMLPCKECGKISILNVAESQGIQFYSCITEGCKDEAQLLVNIGDGEFVRYDKVYNAFRKIVSDGKSNEVNNNESEG